MPHNVVRPQWQYAMTPDSPLPSFLNELLCVDDVKEELDSDSSTPSACRTPARIILSSCFRWRCSPRGIAGRRQNGHIAVRSTVRTVVLRSEASGVVAGFISGDVDMSGTRQYAGTPLLAKLSPIGGMLLEGGGC